MYFVGLRSYTSNFLHPLRGNRELCFRNETVMRRYCEVSSGSETGFLLKSVTEGWVLWKIISRSGVSTHPV
jgi:hypothetical protein